MTEIFTPTGGPRPSEPPANIGHVEGTSPQRPPETPKRRKGGQPGNDNALRHGFYSRSFTRADMASLDSDVKGEFHDEINLARVNANRLADLLKDYKSMPIQDIISTAHALSNFLDRIRSLSRDQRFMYQNLTTIEQALEELKDIPFDED